MNINLPSRLKNGYFASAIAHAVLFIIMAFLFIHPATQVKWHSFEWEQGQPSLPSKGVSSKGLTPQPGVTKSSESLVHEAAKPETEPQVNKGESTRVLEQPQISETSNTETNRSAVRVVRTPGRNALRNIGQNLPGGNFGFSAALEQGEGGAYIISQPKPTVMPTEEGEVYLEFRLTSLGTVDMSSVNILSYTSGNYAESVQKALRNWKFGFKGQYKPETSYRIRCKFVIDER